MPEGFNVNMKTHVRVSSNPRNRRGDRVAFVKPSQDFGGFEVSHCVSIIGLRLARPVEDPQPARICSETMFMQRVGAGKRTYCRVRKFYSSEPRGLRAPSISEKRLRKTRYAEVIQMDANKAML